MRSYEVEFTDRAIANLEESFEWGCENWGLEQATNWYFGFQDHIASVLSTSPQGCPLARDQEFLKAESRVLIIDRYNVVFNVDDNMVTILYISGPFTRRKL